mmetsp:Transcript_6014/g.23952  ORF Transcript_6014/g.23952 Transcript_6014/m.23952 type:complete len:557 (-) Transcript_6014:1630-3300(-)
MLCRGDRRGVLVHIERPVEVRNEGPLLAVQRVDLHDAGRVTVVVLEQLAVDLGHALAVQGLALGRGVMRVQLELAEHGLAEKRAAQTLQRVAELVELVVARRGPSQHGLTEQQLVGGGRDLGDEQRIAGGFVGLGAVGDGRVHRMPPLMGEGADRLEIALVVQEHEGRHAVDAVLVGATALAGRWQCMHGVGPQRGLEQRLVVLAQRLGRLQRQRRRVIERVGLGLCDQGRVDVVVVQVRQAQHLLAQLEVAVQRGQSAAHLGHQRAVDRLGHGLRPQAHRDSAGVAAQLGHRGVVPHHIAQRHAIGVLVLADRAEEGIEDLLAHRAVGALAQQAVAGVVDALGLATDAEFRPLRVGVEQQRARLAGRTAHRAERGNDRLALGAQRMPGQPQAVAQVLGMLLQPRLGLQEGGHPGLSERLDLGLHPGQRAPELAIQLAGQIAALLVGAVAVVGGLLHAGVHAQPVKAQGGRAQGVEPGQQALGAFAQRALERRELGQVRQEPLAGGVPFGVAGEQRAQVPDGGQGFSVDGRRRGQRQGQAQRKRAGQGRRVHHGRE